MTDNNQKIRLRIDQNEQALQTHADALLARPVFKRVAHMLEENLRKINDSSTGSRESLDDCRAHEAILIDGKRGTGKSSILVNLRTYLDSDIYSKTDKGEYPIQKKDLLILKPVDPTLLEDGDDLLLNMIIAALVRDKDVKHELDKNCRTAEEFSDKLQALGDALKNTYDLKNNSGLDRLRSFIGNHDLAQCVHELFGTVLSLTGRKLIVLPIDDVDTSLVHAFGNMEIVRKYLASPYLIPLISGDLDLYSEVIYREFYKKFGENNTDDHKKSASQRSKELGYEYQRKILPPPRRLGVSDIRSYLTNESIHLCHENSKDEYIDLRSYIYWLEAILNGRNNGIDNSNLKLPIRSTRELVQLINHTQSLIPELSSKLEENGGREIDIKRLAVLSAGQIKIVEKVSDELQNITTKSTSSRLKKLQSEYSGSQEFPFSEIKRNSWNEKLQRYFLHHSEGGPAYLTLEANSIWWEMSENKSLHDKNVLDVGLFQLHKQKNHTNFIQPYENKSLWQEEFKGTMPDNWLNHLPNTTILPYPYPEKGRRFSKLEGNSIGPKEGFDYTAVEAEFIRKLMTSRQFFTTSKRTHQIFCGRIFDIIITSIVREISPKNIADILKNESFFSVCSIVNKDSTSGYKSDDEDDLGEDHSDDEFIENNDDLSKLTTKLSKEINKWRLDNRITPPHARYVYNIMFRFFNNTEILKAHPKETGDEAFPVSVASTIAAKSCSYLWSCFAVYEKGSLWGVRDEVSDHKKTNPSKSSFEKSDLYNINIRQMFNHPVNNYTKCLGSHPLYAMIYRVHDELSKAEEYAKFFPISISLSKQMKSHLDSIEEDIETISEDTLREFYQKLKSSITDAKWSQILGAAGVVNKYNNSLNNEQSNRLVKIIARALLVGVKDA